MKLKKIKKTYRISDEVYNAVVDKCEAHVDGNNEAFLVADMGNDYELVYLSHADKAKLYMTKLCFDRFNVTVSSSHIQTAYNTICANVRGKAQKKPTYTRVGRDSGTIYYDLANKSGEVVEIDAKGYRINKKVAIGSLYFYKDDSMLEQVQPVQADYSLLDFIDEFTNIEESQQILFAVYICAAFIPDISHPILIVEGEKGSGKTSINRWLGTIIHPVAKDVFVLPKKADDLVVTLGNNHFAAFDNIGKMGDEFSNIFCQASTGGTLVKRKLYSDNTEICINIKRLVALNGVSLDISQSDLLDRAILIHLNRISGNKRCPDEILTSKFETALPKVLGNVFEILSKALAIYPNLKINDYPRMADFSRYGYAIAEAIGEGQGSKFIEAYTRNAMIATETVIKENPVLDCLVTFVTKKQYWKGSMTELLNELQKCAIKMYTGKSLPASFPNNPNSLSRALNTHKYELENVGIYIDIGRTTSRYVEIKKIN